jgi:hypothetical protein
MTDDYFGYTTGGNDRLMDARRSAHHTGDDASHYPVPESGDYIEPTPNFDQQFGEGISPGEELQNFYANNIEVIYKRIMSQDPVVIRRLADQWFDVNRVLDDLRIRVLNSAKALQDGGDGAGGNAGWSGAGARAFLAAGPGATLKSIDDWEDVAYNTWMGTLTLAGAMETRRGQMEALWQRYKAAMVSKTQMWLDDAHNYDNRVYPPARFGSIDDIPAGSYEADQYVKWMREAQLWWNGEAQKLQYGMARDYWSVMSEEYGVRGTVYEGPTDAVRYNEKFVASQMAPDVPNISTPPNVTKPEVTVPTITPPTITPPDVYQITESPATPPEITPPSVDAPDVAPDVTSPTVTQPDITAPTVTAPAVTAPAGQPAVVPPVLPPALTGGGQGLAPAVRPGSLPTVPANQGLLKNLPGGGGPGVLRSGTSTPTPGGLPGGLPQGGRPGQAPSTPPPAVKGKGPGTPAAPPHRQRGTENSDPAAPGTPATPGMENQFGGPPGTPASPVVRNPHAAPPSRPGGPRRWLTGPAGGSVTPEGSGLPLRPGAAPPVLGRPQPRTPQGAPPAGPVQTPSGPGGPPNPLAPPPRSTTSPVVGRSARLEAGAPQPPEPTRGVVRGRRTDGSSGYEGEIGSRKREVQERQAVDAEFERIRKVLDREGAWTMVETPGGGVLDNAPVRSAEPVAAPKPTLGGA